jgi:hypothetical protein
MNTARAGLASAGTQTLALAFGGVAPIETGATEFWNGTSWTSNPTGLATARQSFCGAGTQTVALAFSGYNGTTGVGATEEWTGSNLATRTITVS